MTVGLGWIDARLARRDIFTLLGSGDLTSPLNRFEVNRERLGDFRREIHAAVSRRLLEAPARDLQSAAPAYKRYVAVFGGRSHEIEEALWTSSGAEDLKPGENIGPVVDLAEELAATAPELAERMFHTALCRELEHLMDGNAFYYGLEGRRAWRIYRDLKGSPGWEAWIRKNSDKALGDLRKMEREVGGKNLGLGVRVIVHRMLLGDEEAKRRVLTFTTLRDLEEGTLDELASVLLPEPFRQELAAALLKTWEVIHRQTRPSAEGFAVAKALGAIGTPDIAKTLLASFESSREQEVAHAVQGLAQLSLKAHGREKNQYLSLIASAANSQFSLVQYAAKRAFNDKLRPGGDSFEQFLRSELKRYLSERAIGEKNAQTVERLLGFYRSPEYDHDLDLIDAVAQKYKLEDLYPALPDTFEALVAHYEGLGAAQGEASYALGHVKALRHFGTLGDPRGVAYLNDRFEKLPHGNMSVAAAESLWRLQGFLGPAPLADLARLTNMRSSVYRVETVKMLDRNKKLIESGPASERDEILAILAQVVGVGEPRERKVALDLLSGLDPLRAWPLARGLAVSSEQTDRLEGLAVLKTLWPKLEK